MPINYDQLEQDCNNGKVDDVVMHFSQNPDGVLNQLRINQIKELVTSLIDKCEIASLLKPELFLQKAADYRHIYDLLNGKVPLVRIGQQDSREKLYSYLTRDRAKRSEDIIQRAVNERFWRVKKTLKANANAFILYTQINQVLLEPLANRQPIVLDGYSTRALILALTKIIAERNLLPSIKFQIGSTVITCDTAGATGRVRQKANFWISVDQLPGERFTYGSWSKGNDKSVDHYLAGICANDQARERQLAVFLITKTHTGMSFVSDDFNENYLIKLAGEPSFSLDRFRFAHQKVQTQDQIQRQIHYLNGLNFLRAICEVARRLYRTTPQGDVHNYQDPKARQSDAMPIALLQARSLELLVRGVVRLKDIFGESDCYGATQLAKLHTGKMIVKDGKGLHRAEFGVATGQSTIEHVGVMAAKADRINSELEISIVRPGITLFASGIRAVPGLQFPIKEGHNLQRKLLGEHFGGDNESDGSDYSDDDEDVVAEINLGSLFM